MLSLPAMSFGDMFCFSRKGMIGGGGWVHPKGANSMNASGLIPRSDLVDTGRAISILYGINGVRNNRSHLVGPPFPALKAATAVVSCPDTTHVGFWHETTLQQVLIRVLILKRLI